MSRTWRERHPFLYGLCMTFGVAPVRQPAESVQQSFDRVAAAIAEAERRAASTGDQESRNG
jgi:hypothetical protein